MPRRSSRAKRQVSKEGFTSKHDEEAEEEDDEDLQMTNKKARVIDDGDRDDDEDYDPEQEKKKARKLPKAPSSMRKKVRVERQPERKEPWLARVLQEDGRIFGKLVEFTGFVGYKRLKVVNKLCNKLAAKIKQEDLERWNAKCCDMFRLPIEPFDMIMGYLQARDFSALACLNTTFDTMSRKLGTTLWKREYKTNPLVRRVFREGRKRLDGTVPPGFSYRTFVIALLSGLCWQCKKKEAKMVKYRGLPFCKDCGDMIGTLDCPFSCKQGDAVRMCYPRLPDYLVRTMPCYVYTYPGGYYRRYEIQAHLYLISDIRWLNQSHPELIAKRRAKEREELVREEIAEEKEKKRRAARYKKMLGIVGEDFIENYLVQDIIEGHRRDYRNVANIAFHAGERKKAVLLELRKVQASEEVRKFVKQDIENYIHMDEPPLADVVRLVKVVQQRIKLRDERLEESGKDVQSKIDPGIFDSFIRKGTGFEDIMDRAMRRVELETTWEDLDPDVRNVFIRDPHLRRLKQDWVDNFIEDPLNVLVKRAKRVLRKEEWESTLTLEERMEYTYSDSPHAIAANRYAGFGEGGLSAVLSSIRKAVKRAADWKAYLEEVINGDATKLSRLEQALKKSQVQLEHFESNKELDVTKQKLQELEEMYVKVENFNQSLSNHEKELLQPRFPILRYDFCCSTQEMDQSLVLANNYLTNDRECAAYLSSIRERFHDKPLLVNSIVAMKADMLNKPLFEVEELLSFKAYANGAARDYAEIEAAESKLSESARRYYNASIKAKYMETLHGVKHKEAKSMSGVLRRIGTAKRQGKRRDTWNQVKSDMPLDVQQVVEETTCDHFAEVGDMELFKRLEQIASRAPKIGHLKPSPLMEDQRKALLQCFKQYLTGFTRKYYPKVSVQCQESPNLDQQVAQINTAFEKFVETEGQLDPEVRKHYFGETKAKVVDMILHGHSVESELEKEVEKAKLMNSRQKFYDQVAANTCAETKAWTLEHCNAEFLKNGCEEHLRKVVASVQAGFNKVNEYVLSCPADIRERVKLIIGHYLTKYLNKVDRTMEGDDNPPFDFPAADFKSLASQEVEFAQQIKKLAGESAVVALMKFDNILHEMDSIEVVDKITMALTFLNFKLRGYLVPGFAPIQEDQLPRFLMDLLQENANIQNVVMIYISSDQFLNAIHAEVAPNTRYRRQLYQRAFEAFRRRGGHPRFNNQIASNGTTRPMASVFNLNGDQIPTDVAERIINRLPENLPRLPNVRLGLIQGINQWLFPVPLLQSIIKDNVITI